jgi:hypothetical protein
MHVMQTAIFHPVRPSHNFLNLQIPHGLLGTSLEAIYTTQIFRFEAIVVKFWSAISLGKTYTTTFVCYGRRTSEMNICTRGRPIRNKDLTQATL